MSRRLSFTTIAICVIGLVGALLFIIRPGVRRHTLELKTYSADALGIRAGAPVRLAGVDVGSVRTVRVRTDLKDTPAEIVLQVSTSYPLAIPRDAIVVLNTAGVLGETYADIDIRGTSGPTAQNGDSLRTRTAASSNVGELMELFMKAARSSNSASSENKDAPRPERHRDR